MPTIQTIEQELVEQLKTIYDINEARSITSIVLQHILQLSRTQLSISKEKELTDQQVRSFEMLTEELMLGKPIQYVLGETEFYSCRIKVNENVLIPRPETEELVDWIIKSVIGHQSTVKETQDSGFKTLDLKILDICTGSGCVPIALKKNIPEAEVSACDISHEALEMAMKNAVLNKTEIRFFNSDVLSSSFSHSITSTFNVIVSNPPYVRNLEKQLMHKNVLEFEPHLALFVEDHDALIFYRKITEFAKSKLQPGGMLFFEINEAYGNEIAELLGQNNFTEIEIRKDMFGKDRMAKGVLKL
ncbi:peptide chain release factor N(5)-glutamine methyltransferase [Solitalea koreensis]|uniref:Release factor glutamine methyltransferase n=1 Tax=Solitalea koreensis TaxID=543615 RepID=A0A521BC30_9SPHI|nr:peptide chain release factor N(5)-glutamine methyltransferase [Solitalea koreensis]SMO44685.1 release factor glutamine methyltransferase [Solitalea koreensis]